MDFEEKKAFLLKLVSKYCDEDPNINWEELTEPEVDEIFEIIGTENPEERKTMIQKCKEREEQEEKEIIEKYKKLDGLVMNLKKLVLKFNETEQQEKEKTEIENIENLFMG
jgi:ERCC4-type nuclease